MRQDGGVPPDTLASVLARADDAPRLPRLGGMARPTGVVVVSERFWAFAGTDGTVREGAMPRSSGFVRRIPFVRGLVRLGMSISPLFRSTGAARRSERLFLGAALVLPFPFVLLPNVVSFAAGCVLSLVLLAVLLRGRTLRLHGAEHRAIAAAEQRRLVGTLAGRARPTRFSPRCGTNFAAIALPVTAATQLTWPLTATLWTPVVVVLLSLAVSMELWQAVQSSTWRPLRALLAPGLALQRLTTREPSLAETQVALAAVGSVLRRELAA
jgi:uncharacterized protein YqhQ